MCVRDERMKEGGYFQSLLSWLSALHEEVRGQRMPVEEIVVVGSSSLLAFSNKGTAFLFSVKPL